MTPREFDHVVRKFRMEVIEGSRHRRAKLYHEGELIISALRSRSPKEFLPHRVRRELNLNAAQLREAISCTIGLDDYLEILKGKDLI